MYFSLTGCFFPLSAGAAAKRANRKAETAHLLPFPPIPLGLNHHNDSAVIGIHTADACGI